MSKRARDRTATSSTTTEVEPVGAREPCPCGSGRRYKACHGKTVVRAEHSRTLRPFAGLANEADWVAMREIVPAATAELSLTDEFADRHVTLSTVLPMALPALVRNDGGIMLAVQTQTSSGDVSRDVGDALRQALTAEAGRPISPRLLPPDAPKVHEFLDANAPLRVITHSGFDYWLEDADDPDPSVKASLERANAAVSPTARLASVAAAYWMQLGERRQVRWVLAEPEDVLLTGLARLQSRGELTMGTGSRYLGSFRAMGLLVPVWDIAASTEVDDVEDPALLLRQRLDDALADNRPLSGDERHARESLLARQLTLQ